MKFKPVNKHWRPKLMHALAILLALIVSFVSGWLFANQEIVAAIGACLSFGYAAVKLWDSLFKGRKGDV
jgi:hypothetical protein